MTLLTIKQLGQLHVNVPAGATHVVVNTGPSVAERGTVTVDYFRGTGSTAPIVSIDVAPDGTVFENEEVH